ncbi:unnamed protein product, partial [marine sediment metagenome]
MKSVSILIVAGSLFTCAALADWPARPPEMPETFTRQTASGRTFTINKGQLNKYRLRPAILNEHAESSREVQASVTNGLIVGQIFRASQDNINGLLSTIESAASESIDDFESYTNSAGLQAQWQPTDTNDPALLATVIVKTGDKSMLLPLDATILDEWAKTNTVLDLTGYTVSIDWYQTISYLNTKAMLFVERQLGQRQRIA